MIVMCIHIGEGVWFKTNGPKTRVPSPPSTFDPNVQSISLFWIFLVMHLNLKIHYQQLYEFVVVRLTCIHFNAIICFRFLHEF